MWWTHCNTIYDAIINVQVKLTGQNLGQVFNSRYGHACIRHAIALITKTALLKVENLGQTT